MKNITAYVENYKDKTFDEMPFNRVDALILSQFAYFKLNGFVPEVGTFVPPVSLSQIASSDKVADLFTDERYRKANRLTWHEKCDAKTMVLVRSEINLYFQHSGGCAECKRRDSAGAEDGGFDE